jgi:hypothetical protein
VNEALHRTIHEMSWRGDEAIKLVFLVADAPPHLDYANDYDYAQEMIAAAWKGIKIHPIASSGLKQDGEFIFRQIAQYTMGHFIFLTYEQGGAGEPGEERPDLAAGQGNYTVDQLDDLVLRLITDEIAALETPVESQGAVASIEAVNPRQINEMPAVFALAQAPVPVSYSAPPGSPQGFDLVSTDDEDDINVSLPLVLIIGIVCLGLGYAVSARRRFQKRKRSLDDLLYNVRDYHEPGD